MFKCKSVVNVTPEDVGALHSGVLDHSARGRGSGADLETTEELFQMKGYRRQSFTHRYTRRERGRRVRDVNNM